MVLVQTIVQIHNRMDLELEDSPDKGQNGDNDKQRIKIALLGNEGVGKTSIISQLVDNRYNAKTNTTVGAMFVNKEFTVEGHKVDLQIWDTAGQERFRTIASIYFRDAHGVMLVYDITNRKSYDDLNFWFNEIYAKCEKSVVVTIVGNKCDMPNNEVTNEEAIKFAQSHKSKHLLVSAKTGQNIGDAFEVLLRDINNSEVMVDINKKIKTSVAVKKKTAGSKSKKKDCSC